MTSQKAPLGQDKKTMHKPGFKSQSSFQLECVKTKQASVSKNA